MLPISAQPTEQSLAETMIKLHGARAIREAEELLHYNASLGDRDGASKWMRVMVLIEFGDLTDGVSPLATLGNAVNHVVTANQHLELVIEVSPAALAPGFFLILVYRK